MSKFGGTLHKQVIAAGLVAGSAKRAVQQTLMCKGLITGGYEECKASKE